MQFRVPQVQPDPLLMRHLAEKRMRLGRRFALQSRERLAVALQAGIDAELLCA